MRRSKVQRLKSSIIEHGVYKRSLKACVSEWRASLAKMKIGNNKLKKVWERFN
jgi:hypothetical protein